MNYEDLRANANVKYKMNFLHSVFESDPKGRVAMKCDTILVLDFGSQYCHLIVRRMGEYNVYSEIVPHGITPREIEAVKKRCNVKGLILSGGPASVYEKDALKCTRALLELNLPVLGLCYGHQLIVYL